MSRTRRIVAAAILTALASTACSGTDGSIGAGDPVSGTVASTSGPVESTSDGVESTGSARSTESSEGSPSPVPVSSTPDSSASESGPVSQSRASVHDATLDDAAAQRISDDLIEALGMMDPAQYDQFTFVHVATALEQVGIPGHTKSTDEPALRAYDRAMSEIGPAGLQMMWIYPDAPFNGTDIVWRLEFGQGPPAPVMYRLRDDVDFDAVIDFFVDHDFDSTERADGNVELTTSGSPIGDIFSAVAYPDLHLFVESYTGFTLSTADATGTPLAGLAAAAGPGVLVSATTGAAAACTDPYTVVLFSEQDPEARASIIESVEAQIAESPLGPITGQATVIRDGHLVAIASYPDVAAAEKDLPGRRTLLDGTTAYGMAYADLATTTVEQDGDLLRYTLDPVDASSISSMAGIWDDAPWRICR